MTENPNIKRVAILVNYSAGGGRAERRWASIRQAVLERLPDDTLEIPFASTIDLGITLKQLIEEEQVNCFISAGGDGSVNYLLNGLLNLENIGTVPFYLGAIGLGSSNDFHKPFGAKIKGIPIRINYDHITQADLGVVKFRSKADQIVQRYFIVNASLGVTAAANYFFNHGDLLLRLLKKIWTNLAILYAALWTILTFKNFIAKACFSEEQMIIKLSNLAILKNPHVSGDMCYDQKIGIADGWLGLNYCDGMSKKELIQTLKDLGKGRFTGRPKRHSFFVKNLEVKVKHPVPLEADGEVFTGTHFEFSIIPKGIKLLSNE